MLFKEQMKELNEKLSLILEKQEKIEKMLFSKAMKDSPKGGKFGDGFQQEVSAMAIQTMRRAGSSPADIVKMMASDGVDVVGGAVTLPEEVRLCSNCNGLGSPDFDDETCSVCDGRGYTENLIASDELSAEPSASLESPQSSAGDGDGRVGNNEPSLLESASTVPGPPKADTAGRRCGAMSGDKQCSLETRHVSGHAFLESKGRCHRRIPVTLKSHEWCQCTLDFDHDGGCTLA